MQDRPTATELLAAVGDFLDDEVVSALSGPSKFHARIAANVVRIVGREIESGSRMRREEWQRLGDLLDERGAAPEGDDALAAAILERNRRLASRIRSGEARSGPWRDRVLDHVRRTVEDKLAVANPRLLEQRRKDRERQP